MDKVEEKRLERLGLGKEKKDKRDKDKKGKGIDVGHINDAGRRPQNIMEIEYKERLIRELGLRQSRVLDIRWTVGIN